MDLNHAGDLKPGARIAVLMGAAVSEIYGTPPIVTTATVVERSGADCVWCETDIAEGETLPQMYRIEHDVLGYLLPMAKVTYHPDGSITGRVEGYVGP